MQEIPSTKRPAGPQANILVVDDERGPRESLRMILQPSYRVCTARNGNEALEILRTSAVDLVTMDLNMPGIQGEELMRTVRREFPEVEVVIITGHGSLDNATEALRYGVGDYLQKPFDVVQVTAAVFRALSRRRGRRRLVRFFDSLGEMVGHDEHVQSVLDLAEGSPRVSRRVGELLGELAVPPEGGTAPRTLAFLEVLADTVESQCAFLRGHARRTGFYAGLLADRLCLSSHELQYVRLAGFLHDIGKVGVPTELLLRPGALTPKERQMLERHPEMGARLVEPLGISTEIIAAIRHHHEWWDGRGYGDGLYGEQIPLAARIVAVADAFDAMTCDRPYRTALPMSLVREELERYAGVQFDPSLAKEFLLLLDTADVDLQLLAESGESAARLVHAA